LIVDRTAHPVNSEAGGPVQVAGLTHLDVSRADVDRALAAFAEELG
jgi:hypothetical protein